MAIQKTNVPVPFHGGVDRNSDENTASPSKLYRLEDALFNDKDTVVTRAGQTEQALSVTPSTIVRAYTHNDVAVIEDSAGSHYHLERDSNNYAKFTSTKVKRASVETVKTVNIPRWTAVGAAIASRPLGNYDVAYSTNQATYLIAWETDTGIQLSLRGRYTEHKEIWRYDTTVLLSGPTQRHTKPRVCYSATGDRFVVYYAVWTVGGTSYTVKSFYVTADGVTTTAGSPATVVATAAGTAVEGAYKDEVLFDVSVYSTGAAFVAARDTVAAPNCRLVTCHVDTSGAPVGGTTASLLVASRPLSLATWNINLLGTEIGYVFYAANGGAQIDGTWSFGGALQPVVNVYPVVAGYTYEQVTAVGDPSSSAYIHIAFESTDLYARPFTIFGKIDLSLLPGVWHASSSSCLIQGRIFTYGSKTFLPLVYDDAINRFTGGEGSYNSVTLLAELTDNISDYSTAAAVYDVVPVARLAPGKSVVMGGAGTWVSNRLPNASILAWPYLQEQADIRLAGTEEQTGVSIHIAFPDISSPLGFTEVNGTTVLAGACPLINDGKDIYEEGFHFPPEIVSTTESTLPTVPTFNEMFIGPLTALGTYNFYVTEGYTDAAGNWHESAPSKVKTVTLTGANTLLTLHVRRPPSLRPAGDRGAATPRKLNLYRTLNQATSTNDTAYLALTDGYAMVTEADLPGGEPLSQSVAPTYVMPACRHVSQFQNRLAVVGSEDTSAVHLSKLLAPGYAPEFVSATDPTFNKRTPSAFGRLVGSQAMDGRLVVLGERRIGILGGQGPDDSGNGEFTEIETAVSELGAKFGAPRSIGLGPEGVWFQDSIGFRIFGRGGGILGVGSEIDGLATGNCTFMGGSGRQLIFMVDSLKAYVWDSNYKQWSVFNNFGATDALFSQGKYRRFYNTHAAYYDTASSSDVTHDVQTDVIATTPLVSLLETNWLQLADLLGFQRVYRMALLMREKSGNSRDIVTTVNTAVDYVDTFTQQFTGTNTGAVIALRHHLSTQKCAAMKFRVQWGVTGAVGAVRVSGMTLEVGVKAGTFKTAKGV